MDGLIDLASLGVQFSESDAELMRQRNMDRLERIDEARRKRYDDFMDEKAKERGHEIVRLAEWDEVMIEFHERERAAGYEK